VAPAVGAAHWAAGKMEAVVDARIAVAAAATEAKEIGEACSHALVQRCTTH
jgi:hypothetical protein